MLHKLFPFLVVLLVMASPVLGQVDTLFHQGFETSGSNLPVGWVNVFVAGEASWVTGVGAGEFSSGQLGIPDTAAQGGKNAYFRVPSPNPHITRMVSPPINLEFAVYPELTFWHAQYPRNGSHSKLVVYYAERPTGPWYILANFQNPVYEWTQRVFQLPSGVKTLYLAFEGHSGSGTPGSVCVDQVTVTEKGALQRYVSSVVSTQPLTSFIPTGSANNPVLRTELRVMGNMGDLSLEKYTVHSLNTDDGDLSAQGVRLWFTSGEEFFFPVLLGSGQDFSAGKATFNNLNKLLPTGYSYLWVTYDVRQEAQHGNFADAYLPAAGILVAGASFPATDQMPPGNREIRKTLFYDNFDTDKGWTLTGEWQRNVPMGLGGVVSSQSQTEGPAGASYPFSGTHVLGTDLTGLGSFPGNYEANLPAHAYQAIMPLQDFSYYNNLTLSFKRWLNVYFFNKASIDVSIDGGVHWENVWTNQLVNNTTTWSQVSYALPKAARQKAALIRFTLGETGGYNLQSGWNIDDLVITGTHVSKDVGVTQWLSPLSSCGMGDQEEVRVLVKNYGASPSPEVIPLAFSLDGGSTWTRDTLVGSIPVGGTQPFAFTPTADFSIPGRYNVLVKTQMPGDQDTDNDQLNIQVFSIPTLQPDFSLDFQNGDALFTGYGANSSWEHALPAASIIDAAHTGQYAWITNPSGYYNASEFSWVESPCIDFSQVQHPVAAFFLKTNILQGIDGVALDYSIDDGVTWKRVQGRFPEFTRSWYNHANINSLVARTGDGNGWTGTTSQWINPRVVLPLETAFHPSVKLRLVFASNNMEVQYEGVAFDMLSVYSLPNDIGVTAFSGSQIHCQLSGEESISISIGNLGINTLEAGTIIPVGIDDHQQGETFLEEFALQTQLLPGQTVDYTFAQTFDMQHAGSYQYTAYTLLLESPSFWTTVSSNDSLSTTIQVLGLPEVNLGDDLYTNRPDTVILDAGAGFSSYLWQDGTTSQTYIVTSNLTAHYRVTVTSLNGCEASDSIHVKTWDMAVSAILSPIDGCQLAEGEYVKAALYNNGYDIFPAGLQVPLTLFLNDQWINEFSFTLPVDLHPAQSALAEFPVSVDMREFGVYPFRVEHSMADANPSNNSFSAEVHSTGVPILELPAMVPTNQPDTLVLDAGPGYQSYLWSNGAISQTLAVDAWGDWWVRVTNGAGCEATAIVKVVPRKPDVSIGGLISPMDGCQDKLVDLRVTVSVVNSGNTAIAAGEMITILYMVNNISVSQDFVLPAVLKDGDMAWFSFIKNITLEKTSKFQIWLGYDKDSNPDNNYYEQWVTVLPSPQPILGDTIYNPSPAGMLLTLDQPYESYLWGDGSTGSQYTVDSPLSRWYDVTVTDTNGCVGKDSVKVIAYDLEILELLSPVSACQLTSGESVAFTMKNNGPDTFENGHVFKMGYILNNGQLTVNNFVLSSPLSPGQKRSFQFPQLLGMEAPGAYALNVKLMHQDVNNQNNETIRTINVHGIPQPDLGGDVFTMQPDTLVLFAGDGFASYLWQDGNTAPMFNVSQYGKHWVMVTDDNGCEGRDSLFVSQSTSLVIPEEQGPKVVLYPNPASSLVTLKVETNDGHSVVWELWTQAGHLILNQKLEGQGILEEQINLQFLPAGVYYLKVINGKGVTLSKFVVTR